MEEVSSRIFQFYSEALTRRGMPVTVLTDGLSSIERVLAGARWYDWADHVRVLERFQAALGGEAAVDRVALESSERRVADSLRFFAGFITDVSFLYRVAFWFGGSLYRHVRFDNVLEGPVLHVSITIPDEHEGSEIFFRMWRGTLRGTPRMLGLPDATVNAETTARRGVFDVILPERRDVWARSRRVLQVARMGGTLIGHLEKHERDLRSAYDALLKSRQDAEERQRVMEAELAVTERLASLGMLAAGVGHEINNPLAYLLLELRLLEKQLTSGKSAAELTQHVTSALEGAGHIERVVRSLKGLAQKVGPDHHAVDVGAVLEDIVRLTQNRLTAGTRLVRNYEPAVFALAEEGPLGQVVTNLFVNAMDAVAAADKQGEIRLTTRALRDHVEIEVSDDGVGLAPHVTKRAFDPFFTTKAPSGGLGLGLTLAHRIVTSLGGTIAIERDAEGWTHALVRLKRCAAPSSATPPAAKPKARTSRPPEPQGPRFDGASVLVIDDQPNLVKTLRMLLDECLVTSAHCGRQGLDAALRERFDLVLCDIVMPDVDGVGIFERLEQHSPLVLPRLVFMTGGAVRPEIQQFLSRIPNACLQKPFTELQLREAMAGALRSSA